MDKNICMFFAKKCIYANNTERKIIVVARSEHNIICFGVFLWEKNVVVKWFFNFLSFWNILNVQSLY